MDGARYLLLQETSVLWPLAQCPKDTEQARRKIPALPE